MFAELGFVAEFLPCDFLGDTVTAVERQPAFIIKQAATVPDPFSQPSQPSSCLEPQNDALLSNSSRRVQESWAHFLSFLNVWLFSLSRVFEGIYKTMQFCECPVACYYSTLSRRAESKTMGLDGNPAVSHRNSLSDCH